MARTARRIAFYTHCLRISLAGALEYRVSFLSQVVFMILNNLLFLFFWWVFFHRFSDKVPWEFSEILLLFSVAATAYGIVVTAFGNLHTLPRIILEGGLDDCLTLPRHPLFFILASRCTPSGLGDIGTGILLFALVKGGDPAAWLLFLCLCCVAAAVYLAFGVLVASLTFYVGSSEGLALLLMNAMITFALYPRALFGTPVKIVLFTLIPAGFMAYLPVELLREIRLETLFALLAGMVVLWILALAVFRRGLRRYASGNLVRVRT